MLRVLTLSLKGCDEASELLVLMRVFARGWKLPWDIMAFPFYTDAEMTI